MKPLPLSVRRGSRGGFLLLEVMLATFIFVVGIIALGRCMADCLNAQQIRVQEDRARSVLENRMAELQASPVLPDAEHRTTINGLTLIERRRTLDVKNEDNVALPNLHEVTITAQWQSSPGHTQARSISFTLLRG